MKKRLCILLLSIFFVAMGCSNAENKAEDQAIEQEESPMGTDSIVLVDDLGHEVTIPASPQRVIAPYLEDDLLTIDVLPITQWSLRGGASIQDYLQDQLKDIPTIPFDLPFEVVTAFNPDLIMLNSAVLAEGEKYELYSKIAPTFVIESEKYDDWRERLKRVANIFGQEEMAQEKIRTYDQLVEEKKKTIKQVIGDESVIALWWFQDTFFVVNEQKSSGEVLYQDLDLTAPNVVKEITEHAEENWLPISLERLAELDAEHLFLITSQLGDGEKALADVVFQHIPAVKKGQVYEYTMQESWLYSGYIANTRIVEQIAESLVKE